MTEVYEDKSTKQFTRTKVHKEKSIAVYKTKFTRKVNVKNKNDKEVPCLSG